jgi:transposase-like protein
VKEHYFCTRCHSHYAIKRANSARGRGWTLHDVLRVALIRGIDDWVESASEDEAGWDETA